MADIWGINPEVVVMPNDTAMNSTSLDPLFLPPGPDMAPMRAVWDSLPTLSALRRELGKAPVGLVVDYVRVLAQEAIAKGDGKRMIDTIQRFDTVLQRAGHDDSSDIRAALNQVITAMLIENDDLDEAMLSAATTLSLLATTPRRKDIMFSALLGMTLYDLSVLRVKRKEYRHAERQISKALKLFERLSRNDPDRFGPAVVLALNASTSIYRSRIEQVNLLAHYQVATTTYMEQVKDGSEEVTSRLVTSLEDEGRMLVSMGRYRESVQFFMRALKYLTRMEPDFSMRQLRLSVDLGEALLQANATRDKGVHLLNTMLHKASRLNAVDEHSRITNILLNAKSRNLDILGLWHKIFPR